MAPDAYIFYVEDKEMWLDTAEGCSINQDVLIFPGKAVSVIGRSARVGHPTPGKTTLPIPLIFG